MSNPQSTHLRTRRLALRTPAVVPVVYKSDTLRFRGVSVDISPKGALVLTPLADAVGTQARLELDLQLGLGPVLRVSCRVVRVNRGATPGLGVAFEELQAQDVLDLERYCGSGEI